MLDRGSVVVVVVEARTHFVGSKDEIRGSSKV